MKTVKNLYPSIYHFSNLVFAAYLAQQGKRYQDNVVQFNFDLERNLLQLYSELKNQTYQPGDYYTFHIFEPKKRMISAAPYRDRVVHHALCTIIHPIFEKMFIYDSYANQVGKGTHRAIRRCQHFLQKNKYVLKADIKKYFPSIDHQILKQLIRRKIGCKKTLWLIDLIIDNSNPQEVHRPYFSGDDFFTPFERRQGLPIGNLTSQNFANIYLNPLDHFVKEELGVKCYIRYVDDFVIFGNDKGRLIEIRGAVTHFLKKMRLLLHPNKCYITPTSDGITFLGQRIFETHRLIQSKNIRRARKRIRRKVQLLKKGKLTHETMEHSLNSWLGHIRQANTFGLEQKIRTEIQAMGLEVLVTAKQSWRLMNS